MKKTLKLLNIILIAGFFYILNTSACLIEVGNPEAASTSDFGSSSYPPAPLSNPVPLDSPGAVTPISFLPDTGQNLCSSGINADSTMLIPSDIEVSVPGQDGHYENIPESLEQIPYSANDIVYDYASGLIWQRCSAGETYHENACVKTEELLYTKSEADNYCSALNTTNTSTLLWRLPEIHEILLLPDYGHFLPVVNNAVFIHNYSGSGSLDYWSNTASSSGPLWGLDLLYGQNILISETSQARVRCVAALPIENRQNYLNNSNGTITDTGSNLTWLICPLSDSLSPLDHANSCSLTKASLTWVNALHACENLDYAGRTDWRLPSVRELASVANFTSTDAIKIDNTAFPGSNGSYWSSTTDLADVTNAYFFNFNEAQISSLLKNTEIFVRCVTGP